MPEISDDELRMVKVRHGSTVLTLISHSVPEFTVGDLCDALLKERRRPWSARHVLGWIEEESAQLKSCGGTDVEDPPILYRDEPRTCPRCGKSLWLYQSVYATEQPPSV